MPLNSQETTNAANEIDHWLTVNHFDDHIKTYSDKSFGRLWWKKTYAAFYEQVKRKPKRIQKIEAQITRINNLPQFIIRPLASWFLNIKTKQKLVNFYHAKELAIQAKEHIAKPTQQNLTAVQLLVIKLSDNLNLKGIGKYANKVASLIRGFIYKQDKQVNHANSPNVLNIANENSNNKQILSPVISKDFYNEISTYLKESDFNHILYLLENRKILNGLPSCYLSEPHDLGRYWKIILLLDSNNHEVRRATIFCIMLYMLKSILNNQDEILEDAIKASQSIKLSLQDHFCSPFSLFDKLKIEIFSTLLKYHPVPLKSVTYMMRAPFHIRHLESFLPESVTNLKIIIDKDIQYNKHCNLTACINDLVDYLPRHIKHLDLSEARIVYVKKDELSSIFRRLPLTLLSLDVSNNYLSKSSDENILKLLSSLPTGLTGLNISEENITEENKKRLDRLSSQAKLQVTKNNLSLKNIITNYMWAKMNPLLDKNNHQVTLTQNGKSVTSQIPNEIGEFIESNKHYGFHN